MSAQKGNILVPVLAAVALIALIAAGLFFWQNQQLQNSSVTPSIIPTPTPVITPQDETANWKTYVDAQNRFSFKYPDDMSVSTIGFIGGSGEIKTKDFAYSNPPQGFRIELQIYPENSLDDQVSLACTNAMTGEKFDGCNISDLIVNGNKVVKSEISNGARDYFVYGNNFGVGLFGGGTTKQTYNNIFDQILSTFKFTSQN